MRNRLSSLEVGVAGLDEFQTYLLNQCIAHKLLEPIPGMIWPEGGTLKILPPSHELRAPGAFERWKNDHLEKLPDWVKGLDNSHIFYFKIWQLADLLRDLDCLLLKDDFLEKYWAGETVASDPAPEPAPEDPVVEAGGEGEEESPQGAADDLMADLGL